MKPVFSLLRLCRVPAFFGCPYLTVAVAAQAPVELRAASNKQMVAAVYRAQNVLKAKKAIGMLFYAGHGFQLDWRNFMVPIDAKLTKASEVSAQAVDVNSVIDAFKTAGNRMNIVVLDACRDNPFGEALATKGLAPMDAPADTFLAYATAPGNVAEDGETSGSNGLYTRYLLQELTRPVARIEDVFKRVRLNVRQQSRGRQIPWESTSLEDDFYFNDDKIVSPVQLSSSELARTFAVEKQDWAEISASRNAADFYAFLVKYPKGFLTEQAQFRLDQVQRKGQARRPDGVTTLDANYWVDPQTMRVVRNDILFRNGSRIVEYESSVLVEAKFATASRSNL